MTVLLALVLALGVLTAANLLLLFAVLRRLREVEEREPSAWSGTGIESVPAVGTHVTVAGMDPDATVLFLSPGCAPCAELVARVAAEPALLAGPAYAFVVGDETDPRAREHARELPAHVEVAYVHDHGGVLDAFGGVDMFPTVVTLVDGVVRTSGQALDALPVAARGW